MLSVKRPLAARGRAGTQLSGNPICAALGKLESQIAAAVQEVRRLHQARPDVGRRRAPDSEDVQLKYLQGLYYLVLQAYADCSESWGRGLFGARDSNHLYHDSMLVYNMDAPTGHCLSSIARTYHHQEPLTVPPMAMRMPPHVLPTCCTNSPGTHGGDNRTNDLLCVRGPAYSIPPICIKCMLFIEWLLTVSARYGCKASERNQAREVGTIAFSSPALAYGSHAWILSCSPTSLPTHSVPYLWA